MSGGRSRSFRLGDRAELLVEHLLAGVAFTTRIPRQEDIGIDFMCSLITGSHGAGLLKAGPFFSVQSKSSRKALVYKKPHELQWIRNQQNPLLICVADRRASAMDVYSTWNLVCAVQGGCKGQAPSCIRLCPGEVPAEWPGVKDNPDGSQDVLLGKPIVRITHDQVFNENSTKEIAEVLERWVVIDRENIVNRYAGLHWVVAPRTYETGKCPGGPDGCSFYWNPKSLQKCNVNLGRSAAAMWRVLQSLPEQSASEPWKTGIPRLKELLQWLRVEDPNLGIFIGNLDS
jgi:hypothetical protein